MSKRLEITGEMKVMKKFCPQSRVIVQHFWNLKSISSTSLWCYFRQIFMYLAFRKCEKKARNMLKNLPVHGFCPLKVEIARFLIRFRLNTTLFMAILYPPSLFQDMQIFAVIQSDFWSTRSGSNCLFQQSCLFLDNFYWLVLRLNQELEI